MMSNRNWSAGTLRLAEISACELLRWGRDRFPDGTVAVSSSFQTQSVPLLHLVAATAPELPVLFVDTGYHFPETLRFRDQLAEEFGLNLRVLKITAESGVRSVEAPYRTNPDLCCEVRKVQPVQQAMREYRGWISGIRRDQSSTRAAAQVVEESDRGLVRIHPLLEWTHADIMRHIRKYNLPSHPLTARGYTSIGCLPCTRLPTVPDDPRSGRWQGHTKTECGLHTKLRGSTRESE